MLAKYNNIEAERVRNGMTKEELAKAIGVSYKTYYLWMSDKSPISVPALTKMADMFGVTLDYLMGRTDVRN